MYTTQQRQVNVVGPYGLLVNKVSSGGSAYIEYPTQSAMVSAVTYGRNRLGQQGLVVIRAYSPRGRLLAISELVAHGQRQFRLRFYGDNFADFVFRQGPVPGIGRRRNGHYFRRMKTIALRRQAALVVFEEGEVSARPSRTASGLPSSWDDYSRSIERGWKTQHKGRKAWAR